MGGRVRTCTALCAAAAAASAAASSAAVCAAEGTKHHHAQTSRTEQGSRAGSGKPLRAATAPQHTPPGECQSCAAVCVRVISQGVSARV
jgi:hypothetical protein